MANFSSTDLFSVKGMVFVITGGGSGLGEWMAQAFDANGASKVFILGRRKESLERVAASAINKSIIPIQCDITSKTSLASAAAEIGSQTPFINTLIANAGLIGPITALPSVAGTESLDEIYTQLWATSQPDSVAVLDTNVASVYYLFLAFLRPLAAGNTHADSRGTQHHIQSQFLTIGSMGGLVRHADPGHIYLSSKAAVMHLTKCLSTDFAPYGIRANSIAPGLFITEMTGSFFVDGGKGMATKGALPKEVNPAMRSGSPEDIAGTALWLVSRAGAYVNGCIVLLDGGATSITPATY
ncbi:short chain dehydrogenase/reductase family [Melanomma pulvis-pyrius CBS 109.77]|uniref:Short chain dehydrogenase/reductase family n=1 Tax=Melanomma pulvis-pyrius CBS 109.77 TaxID=1314802 RepID=A0A6A6XZA0_9PLEO|nr:short chain dehydrogenase/reductase family [Melanomma pulvis-pyrius CBS 109.77]